ncbi:MAG: STAS domain-containing protein, partial [Ruminiclostridium sp.]
MQIYNNGEQVTVCLKGDIDHHSVTSMRMEIDAVLESTSPKLLILDFSEVSFMDSSGIGLPLPQIQQGAHKRLFRLK